MRLKNPGKGDRPGKNKNEQAKLNHVLGLYDTLGIEHIIDGQYEKNAETCQKNNCHNFFFYGGGYQDDGCIYSRVEDWRGTVSPFPVPASSNPACGFPAPGFPVNFI